MGFPLDTLYCTDEAIAIRSPGDFAIVVPRDQVWAEGADGAFVADDRWTLASASADFVAAGIAPGMIVRLTAPAATYRAPGETLVVDAVTSATALRLRRKAAAAGQGKPPGPAGGITGVAFSVPTLRPQIEAATYDLNQRFSIDESAPGRAPADAYDLRELEAACIWTVLAQQYAASARGGSEGDDDLVRKAKLACAERDAVLARVALHWKARYDRILGSLAPEVSIFSTRLSR